MPLEATGGLETVAVRVPDRPVALALLSAFGGGVTAPSANRFGSVSPTTADHVRAELGDAVDFVLDGGPCEVGVESTIIDATG
ncbi:Threonylcarbamoyl-AMP synthase [Streptomyces sp. enrichment culture]